MKTYRNSIRGKRGLIDLLLHLEIDNIDMIELGSAGGESMSIFSDSNIIRSIVCVDIWQAYPELECEFDKKMTSKVKKLKMDVTEAVKLYDDKSFDFIYIDADHAYSSISRDIDMWLPKTRRYIGGHDYTWKLNGVIQSIYERFDRPEYVFMDGSWLIDLDFRKSCN